MRESFFAADRSSARPDSAEAALGVFGRSIEARWIGLRLSTLPADRAATEEGVRAAYREIGLGSPRIIWRDGPVGLAASWAAASARAGPNVRALTLDAACDQAIRKLDARAHRHVRSLRARFGRDGSAAVSAAVRATVLEDCGAARPSLLPRLRRLGSWLASVRQPSRFADSGLGPNELCALGFTASVLEALEPRAVTGLAGLRLIAENAGWILPHAQICWLSDRPDSLSFKSGRLHASSAPALRYRDGWTVHAWKGTRVPDWIIMEPQRITLDRIDAEVDPAVRHAMIDIFTPERFIATGGAGRAASDAGGTLWFRRWSYHGATIDSWAAVELPTPGRGRLFRSVPAHLRTPDEARAWLFGATGAARDAERVVPAMRRAGGRS